MKVFIVEAGEQHEGGGTEGVYDTKEKAVEAALKVPCHFDGGWQWEGTDPHDLYWENGCDYVQVRELEVK